MKKLAVSISDELAQTLDSYCRDHPGDPMLTVTVESALTEYLARGGYYGPFRPFTISPVEPENGTTDRGGDLGDGPAEERSFELSGASLTDHADQDTPPAPWSLDEATLRQRLEELQYRPGTNPFLVLAPLDDSSDTDASIEHDRHLAEASYSDRHRSDLRPSRREG